MQNKKSKYDLKVEPQTLFLLVGPSMSGKTTFARHAIAQLEAQLWEAHFADWYNPVIRHINSDDIRRSLYGVSDEALLHKYDTRMLHASHAAFEALTWQVQQAMRLPFNAEFIIVDSTGLDPAFREQIKTIAESNSYKVVLVLFDYKKNEDYFVGLDEHLDSQTKYIVHKHIRRLREGYAHLKLRSYDDSLAISKKDDIQKVRFEIDLENYRKTFLDAKKEDGMFIPYQFFGDIQGCYKTLVRLLEKDGFKIDPETLRITGRDSVVLVFVGDLIDKGPDSISVVRLLLANRDRVRVVMGNHENFVYKFLTGKLKDGTLPPVEIMDSYFTSIVEFKKNPDAVPEFIEFVETMCVPFLRSLEFVVTHAPCPLKHIGKLHGEGRKKQMNVRLGMRRKDFDTSEAYTEYLEKHLGFLEKDAISNMPLHIFGHVMLGEPLFLRKAKLCLDTGAANKDGFLTSCQLGGGRKPYFISEPIHPDEIVLNEPMPILFKKKKAAESIKDLVDLSVLDEHEERRLFRMANKKINFVSGTMSPSWVDTPAGKLESVHAALSYYASQKVQHVVLQPKYMGSRAQLYLFAEKPEAESPDQDMIVSRNGFTPRFLKQEAFFDQMRERHRGLFKELNARLLIFDGELMPWSALGEGLIEDIFAPIAVGIRTELEQLVTALGLPEAYEGLMASFEAVKQDVNTTSKQELAAIFGLQNPDFESRFAESRPPDVTDEEHERGRKAFAEKLGQSKVSSFYAMKEFKIIPFEEQKRYVEIYQRQLEVFGQMPDETKANPFDYKAFALLKAIDMDGKEKVFVGPDDFNDVWWRKINDDECLVLDLEKEEDWKKGEAFFEKLAAAELEGVVVKPRQTQAVNSQVASLVAPYIKVRAPNYLTLIYGWDYLHPERYQELMRKKSISRKVQISIKEYELGRRLLEIPRAEISSENQQYLSLAMQLILEERAEKKLDPCL